MVPAEEVLDPGPIPNAGIGRYGDPDWAPGIRAYGLTGAERSRPAAPQP